MNQGMKKQHLWDLLDCKSLADKEKKNKQTITQNKPKKHQTKQTKKQEKHQQVRIKFALEN